MRNLLFAAALLFALSCSEKPKDDGNNFHIAGTVEGLPDGEKLLLTDAEGMIIDTLTVAQGKFSYAAKTDTVSFYSIFVLNNPNNNVNLFTDTGTVQVRLTAKEGEATVGGTTANDALNLLMKETNTYYEKINELESILTSDTTLTPENDWVIAERYRQFYGEIEKRMIEAAEKNTDNELGYMLVARFIDEQQNATLVRQLIGKMPDAYRRRQPIVKLLALLDSFEATAEGHVMPDFTLLTPDSTQMSILDEVRRHKFTILTFWASWCNSCRAEVPAMRLLYKDYSEKGLGIVGISLDERSEEWKKAIEDLKIEWLQLSDLKGRENTAARAFRISSIPFTVVADSTGVILKKGLSANDLSLFISEQLP